VRGKQRRQSEKREKYQYNNRRHVSKEKRNIDINGEPREGQWTEFTSPAVLHA
jgi:hypothetical protein